MRLYLILLFIRELCCLYGTEEDIKTENVVTVFSWAKQQINRCTGTVYKNNFVITAAHCCRDALKVQVITGTQNLSESVLSQNFIPVTKIFTHPSYNAQKSAFLLPGTFDLAVLVLGNPILSENPVTIKQYTGEEELFIMGTGHVRSPRGYPDFPRKTPIRQASNM